MIEGRTERFHLGDLMQWLQLGGLTGRLRLSADGFDRRLDLVDGRIVFVSSTDPRERLGSWLAAEEVLPTARIRHLLGVSMLRRRRFTALLVEEGGVDPATLSASLARLAEEMVARLLGPPSVRFAFDPGSPVNALDGLELALDPTSLVMEASRRADERPPEVGCGDRAELPFTGPAFEELFWELIRDAVPPSEPVDGERLSALHGSLRDITGTLAEWLAASPGLVPLPAGQAAWITERGDRSGPAVDLTGVPHAAWNHMVLAHSVRCAETSPVTGLSQLSKNAEDLDLWLEMTTSDRWRRPHSERLDALVVNVVDTWLRGATAAGSELGVDPDEVALTVHLLVVPVDLVLWVLTTLPVPHRRLRHTLVRRLPQRLGLGLTRRADLPEDIRRLFAASHVTPLAVAIHLARQHLPSAHVWPRTVPDDEAMLLDAAPAATLTRASNAAREAMADRSADLDLAVG